MRIGRILVALAVCLSCASTAWTQTPDARLLITIIDPSNAVLPGAVVTVTGMETATKAVATAPGKASDKGLATFDALAPGRYTIEAEFPGFEKAALKDVRLKSGDNKHVLMLPLKGLDQSVTVGQDRQERASERAQLSGTALTREQIELLSDDPDEMAQQLKDLAGPNAVLRVDSFEGQDLPPKAQIKSIHITRNQFAAETHFIGGIFIDIITQPGVGPLRTSVNTGLRPGSLTGKSAFAPTRGPENSQRYGANLSGSLAKDKSSFSLSGNGSRTYTTPLINVFTPDGNQQQVAGLRQPFNSVGLSGLLDYAITKDQTMRFSGSWNRSTQENLGVGAYDLPERAYHSQSHGFGFTALEAGPLGRRWFINTRANVRFNRSDTQSATEAPTIRVNDAFTSGGAQRAGGRDSASGTVQSDLDYIRGRNSWRTGVQLDFGSYQSNDASNYLGTYTFASLADYEAGIPVLYTKRIGNPNIDYGNAQLGAYLQDDIRIRKNLTLSPGVRYEVQTHVNDYNNWGPRFGVTWSPFKSGKTSLQLGGGVFYDWFSTGTYEQTLRVDGVRQQELDIVNPPYPDPGAIGAISAVNKYLLGQDLRMSRNTEVIASVSQTITKRLSGGISWSDQTTSGISRGLNLNAPVNGVRPDPLFSNVIETVSDGSRRSKDLSVNLSLSLVTGPAAQANRFNWKRLSIFGFYDYTWNQSNTEGAFTPPASGSLAAETAHYTQQFGSISLNSTQLKNLNVGLGLSINSGNPYTITTGFDDNGDTFFNDRPAGVGRLTQRTPMSWTPTLRLGYTFGFGHAKAGAAAVGAPGVAIMVMNGIVMSAAGAPGAPAGSAAPRYRATLSVSVNNFINRTNLTGYSGVLTSPFFGQPTAAGNLRRVEAALSFSF
jgi:hypothetical protein